MNVQKKSSHAISEAVEILNNGGVVICPSDTNYMVITHLHSKEGTDRIFKMKNRENISPLTLVLENAYQASDYVYTTPIADYLMRNYWPCQLNFILWRKPTIPSFITCNFPTAAVTVCKNEIVNNIVRSLNMPVAATSANLSGTGTVPIIEKAISHIGSDVDLIIDDGPSDTDNSSTIIDFTLARPVLARAGAFPIEIIEKQIPNLEKNISNYKELLKERIAVEWNKSRCE